MNTKRTEIFIKNDLHFLSSILLTNCCKPINKDLQQFLIYSTLLSEVVMSIFLSIKYIAQFTSTENPTVIRLLII